VLMYMCCVLDGNIHVIWNVGLLMFCRYCFALEKLIWYVKPSSETNNYNATRLNISPWWVTDKKREYR